MKKLPRIFAMLLSLTLCLGTIPFASAGTFSDVPRSHWAYSHITAMESMGLVQGSNGKFRPNETVTNQAFLAMVCRASGLDDRKLESIWSADPIIAYGQYLGWFEEEELTANNKGKPITREFAAKLLVKALFPDEIGGNTRFTDESSIGRERLPYVRTAAKLGLITGYEDGSFRPQAGLTRAAAAALLNRSLEAKATPVGSSIQVPLLMYHDVSYLGEGYSKTPEVFRAQMEELKEAGFHTVSYAQIVDYVENGTPLPPRPIVISVDDGYRSNYEYMYPILQELDMKAEIALIGAAIQYTNWGLKWDEVREMKDSGLVSFQAHTYMMHEDSTASGGRLGVLRAPNEPWLEYVETFGADTTRILDKIETETGSRPIAFVYPRGKWNHMSEAVITALGCKVSVTTKDGIAVITQGDPASLHLMDRIGMDFRNGSVLSVLKQFGYQF